MVAASSRRCHKASALEAGLATALPAATRNAREVDCNADTDLLRSGPAVTIPARIATIGAAAPATPTNAVHMPVTKKIDSRVSTYLLLACLMLWMTAAHATSATHTAAAPNVLVILTDDLGYADLDINNPKAGSPTPNLDALARAGTRFTRFYADSSCSPARAALLTGRYPARFGFVPNGLGLSPQATTLPEAFRAAGYRTHMIGKWHLGHLLPALRPDAQGFDTWLGFLNQWLMRDARQVDEFKYGFSTHLDPYLQNEKGELKRFPGHLTDIATDEAIRLINSERDGAPWFTYLAYFAPHEPIEPRADYAARFPASPAGRYAALMTHLDDRIRDVLRALEATGQRERTIVVFASDNGGTNANRDNNAPLRGGKIQFLEGGVRTPLAISAPGRVPAGLVTDQVVSIMDIYPTVASLAGVAVPADLDGRAFLGKDGSLLPNLPRRALFWEMTAGQVDSFGVLSDDGRWRLYTDWLGKQTLFDLRQDPTSSTDVAAAHPEIVRRLRREYERWKTGVARIDVVMPQRDTRGHGMLVGDDVQRAVTFGDFTIALGITPAAATAASQVIMAQTSALRIDSDRSGLGIRLHGFATRLPALPIGRCSRLVITGRFDRRIEQTESGPSQLNVYLDGNKVSSQSQVVPRLDDTDISAPTYLGSDVDGSQRFDGSLSVPIYLNTRADGAVPAALGVEGLGGRVCAGAD